MNFTERNTAAETARNIPSIKSSATAHALQRSKKAGYKAAKTMFPVLLTGETGTGKEVFANAIHNNGEQREKPMVSINCAAIPNELLESELFGYEEGAFTGAKKGRQKGKI